MKHILWYGAYNQGGRPTIKDLVYSNVLNLKEVYFPMTPTNRSKSWQQAWHGILVEKIQELQVNHRENTGDFCHFTGNTGITGGCARPAGNVTGFGRLVLWKVTHSEITYIHVDTEDKTFLLFNYMLFLGWGGHG